MCERAAQALPGQNIHIGYQNKEFIYRGNEFARLDDFTSRIQAKFPDAKLLTYTIYPPTEVLNSPAKHLQIFAVKPRAEEPHATPASPRSILEGRSNQAQFKFFQSNRVKNFVYSK
ncbi:MAG: hypothetical protein J0G29_00225, partial [Alphaproteobacteria bacterium]|nr:hypothetical protein [Alphaproteobacteria bacterium]